MLIRKAIKRDGHQDPIKCIKHRKGLEPSMRVSFILFFFPKKERKEEDGKNINPQLKANKKSKMKKKWPLCPDKKLRTQRRVRTRYVCSLFFTFFFQKKERKEEKGKKNKSLI